MAGAAEFRSQWNLEAVTGRSYAELLSTEIWQKIGAESAAVIAAPRRGVPVAHGGVSSTLRDLARFGLLFTPTGRAGKDPLISDRYLENIQKRGRPEVFRAAPDDEFRYVDGEPARHNSYQWDFVLNDGDFFKSGFGGQGPIHLVSRDVVIVFFGTLDENGKRARARRASRDSSRSRACLIGRRSAAFPQVKAAGLARCSTLATDQCGSSHAIHRA